MAYTCGVQSGGSSGVTWPLTDARVSYGTIVERKCVCVVLFPPSHQIDCSSAVSHDRICLLHGCCFPNSTDLTCPVAAPPTTHASCGPPPLTLCHSILTFSPRVPCVFVYVVCTVWECAVSHAATQHFLWLLSRSLSIKTVYIHGSGSQTL